MDIRKLQRAIVDGLEDVKAQNIVVFNTEHLSSLFERVVIASGTSNRQTKSLASSVRDAVRAIGLPPPRVEGEANGEWIIVDCGAAVVHVMQPAFREYYHLEELWGDKPVKVKLGVAKGLPKAAAEAEPDESDVDGPGDEKAAAARSRGGAAGAKSARGSKLAAARKTVAAKKSSRSAAGGGDAPAVATNRPATRSPRAGAQSPAGGAGSASRKRASGSGSTGDAEAGVRRSARPASLAGVKRTTGVKTSAGVRSTRTTAGEESGARPRAVAPAKKATRSAAGPASAKPPARETPARKAPARKAPAGKAPARKTPARKTAARKTPAGR